MSEIFESVDFKRRAKTINLPKYDLKLLAYPFLLNKFSNVEQVQEDHLVIGSVLIKGWLNIPDKKFDYDKTDVEFMLEKFNQALNEGLSYQEIMDLSLYFGDGSGVMAMLHFLNPYGYPMHTPEIDKILYGKKASTHQWKEQYIWQFIEACQSLCDHLYSTDKRFKQSVKIVNTKLKEAGYNYSVGEMRSIEMCLLYGNESYKN